MLRMRKEPVYFEIPQGVTIVGIPRHAYRNGVFGTRSVPQIAMLRRLVTAGRIKEVDAPPVVVKPVTYGVEDKSWHELIDMGRELGVFKVGMRRSELIQAIIKRKREENATDEDTIRQT